MNIKFLRILIAVIFAISLVSMWYGFAADGYSKSFLAQLSLFIVAIAIIFYKYFRSSQDIHLRREDDISKMPKWASNYLAGDGSSEFELGIYRIARKLGVEDLSRIEKTYRALEANNAFGERTLLGISREDLSSAERVILGYIMGYSDGVQHKYPLRLKCSFEIPHRKD